MAKTNNIDLKDLKVEITKDALRKYIYDLVITQELVMFTNKRLAELKKKDEKDLSEPEKQAMVRAEANVEAHMDGIKDADERINNFLSIIESYQNNKPVKL